MKRPREILCPIADTRVRIRLRGGRTFAEPGSLYVWCSERDCQYVDQNREPCPLRVEMFDGEIPYRQVVGLISKYRGQPVCYVCLAETLGVLHTVIRHAAWRLQQSDGAIVRVTRCTLCQHRAVTLAVRADAGDIAEANATPQRVEDRPSTRRGAASRHDEPDLALDDERVLSALRGVDDARCMGCLALEARLALSAVLCSADRLLERSVIHGEDGECGVCARRKRVVSLALDRCVMRPGRAASGRGS